MASIENQTSKLKDEGGKKKKQSHHKAKITKKCKLLVKI